MLLVGAGAALTMGAVATVAWTDTKEFCGTCHTMAPELKAYDVSPHRNVECVACHVEPGLGGWVKAKWNGTRQLVDIILGSYPRPIEPPDHTQLPSTEFTCRRCHDVSSLVAAGSPVKLVLHNQYALDADSTRSTVALVLRPNGFGGTGQTVGVHWHIDSDVEFLAADSHAQQIDYVSVTRKDGSTEQYIASDAVTDREDVARDVTRLSAAAPARRMDCIDCHNRIGHEVPTIDNALDAQIDAGSISTDLPDIKRQALARLSQTYTSEDEANRAIASLRTFYELRYPIVAR
jgi:nitrate/TMAO reductase-like tetraheme cytochrome c subunit